MKIILSAFFVLWSHGLWAQLKLEISASPKQTAIECEPVQLTIAWQNISDKEMKIGYELNPADSGVVTWLVNGQARLRMVSDAITSLVNAPNTLKPGEKKEGKIIYYELDVPPGTYEIKAVADFRSFPQEFSGNRPRTTRSKARYLLKTGRRSEIA